MRDGLAQGKLRAYGRICFATANDLLTTWQVHELVDLNGEVDIEFAAIAGGAGVIESFTGFIKELVKTLPAFMFGDSPTRSHACAHLVR